MQRCQFRHGKQGTLTLACSFLSFQGDKLHSRRDPKKNGARQQNGDCGLEFGIIRTWGAAYMGMLMLMLACVFNLPLPGDSETERCIQVETVDPNEASRLWGKDPNYYCTLLAPNRSATLNCICCGCTLLFYREYRNTESHNWVYFPPILSIVCELMQHHSSRIFAPFWHLIRSNIIKTWSKWSSTMRKSAR